jgi:hypothetical protein
MKGKGDRGRSPPPEKKKSREGGEREKENYGRHTVLQRQRRREYRDRQESCSNFHS